MDLNLGLHNILYWWQSNKSKGTRSTWTRCWARAVTVVSMLVVDNRPTSRSPSRFFPKRTVSLILPSRPWRLSQGCPQKLNLDPPEAALRKYRHVLRRHGELQKLLHHSVTLRWRPNQGHQTRLPAQLKGVCRYASADLQRLPLPRQGGHHPQVGNLTLRDLKPANIMKKGQNLKLGDFGFAKQMENKSQMVATMVGTPLYMSI